MPGASIATLASMGCDERKKDTANSNISDTTSAVAVHTVLAEASDGGDFASGRD